MSYNRVDWSDIDVLGGHVPPQIQGAQRAHHDSGLLGMLRESQEKRGLQPAE